MRTLSDILRVQQEIPAYTWSLPLGWTACATDLCPCPSACATGPSMSALAVLSRRMLLRVLATLRERNSLIRLSRLTEGQVRDTFASSLCSLVSSLKGSCTQVSDAYAQGQGQSCCQQGVVEEMNCFCGAACDGAAGMLQTVAELGKLCSSTS